MKDSSSIFQITLLKVIIILYFLYIILNTLISSDGFFHDNAEFGIWAIISLFLISGFILMVDIAIISVVSTTFKAANKRVYILIVQLIICAVAYFGINYMIKNANKGNEYAANVSENEGDTLQIISDETQLQGIYIKDKSQYDQAFIDGLADYNAPIKLIDNYIVTGADTTYFPEGLILNKSTTFKARSNKNNFLLTVTRTNFTTITYHFQVIYNDNKTVKVKSGKATLGSMFFLASEVDEDSKTGDSYGSHEYCDKTNGCWFAIRVGGAKDDNGKQRATLNYGCNDKSKQTLNLDDCPTLHAE